MGGLQPWLAFGCSVSAVSALLLGICTTYQGACYLRFFGGLLNGTLTVTKSALAELCDGYITPMSLSSCWFFSQGVLGSQLFD